MGVQHILSSPAHALHGELATLRRFESLSFVGPRPPFPDVGPLLSLLFMDVPNDRRWSAATSHASHASNGRPPLPLPGATTNSASGVTDLTKVLPTMQVTDLSPSHADWFPLRQRARALSPCWMGGCMVVLLSSSNAPRIEIGGLPSPDAVRPPRVSRANRTPHPHQWS